MMDEDSLGSSTNLLASLLLAGRGGEAGPGLGERGGGGGGSGGALLMRGSLSWVSHGSQTRKLNINLNTRSIPRS